jgi:hypothetical protein
MGLFNAPSAARQKSDLIEEHRDLLAAKRQRQTEYRFPIHLRNGLIRKNAIQIMNITSLDLNLLVVFQASI